MLEFDTTECCRDAASDSEEAKRRRLSFDSDCEQVTPLPVAKAVEDDDARSADDDDRSAVDVSSPSEDTYDSEMEDDKDAETRMNELFGKSDDSVCSAISDLPLRAAARSRKIQGGSQAYFDKMIEENVQPGPTTVVGLSNMTARLTHSMFDASDSGACNLHRFVALVSNGCALHHDFAGRQGYETALKLIQADMKRYGMKTEWLVIWRNSEPNVESRLSAEKGRSPPEHSFQKVEDIHLRDCDHRWIADNAPGRLAPREEIAAFHEKWKEYVFIVRSQIFTDEQRSTHCTLHSNARCPVRWKDSRPLSQQGISVGAGGPHCTPYTRNGAKLGMAHKGQVPFALFIGEHSSGEFDISIIEEDNCFVKKYYVEPMMEKHIVVHANFGPEDLGVGAMRKRFMGGGLNKQTIVWVGPEGDVTNHFLSFFRAHVTHDANIFARLDPQGHKELREILAQRKGLIIDGDEGDNIDILSSSDKKNLLDAKACISHGQKVGPFGGVAVDISQTASRARFGPWLPTLQTSTRLCCPTCPTYEDYLYTEAELSMAHGWPTLNSAHTMYRECLNYDLSKKPLHQQQRLLGDGMSLIAVQAWLLYLFSHSLKRVLIEKFDPPLSIELRKPAASDEVDFDAFAFGTSLSEENSAIVQFDSAILVEDSLVQESVSSIMADLEPPYFNPFWDAPQCSEYAEDL